MPQRSFQIMVVPDRSARVRRWRVSYHWARSAVLGALAVIAVLGFGIVHYAYQVSQASLNADLTEENTALRVRLRGFQDNLQRIEGELRTIDEYAAKVRTITRLSDPERNLAIGPLEAGPSAGTPAVIFAPGERTDVVDELLNSNLALRMIDAKLDTVNADTRAQQENLGTLHTFFGAHPGLLRATPSVRPVASRLVNSGFGPRRDPYTAQQVMHKGVDYATDLGAEVWVTADGTVVFAASRGKYGKTVVVDHGDGYQTHYAHLSAIDVKTGDDVQRGATIGRAGNTGRTTGVHLHYEVRLHGIPQDPLSYMLD